MSRACAITLLGAFSVHVDGELVPAAAWHQRRGADLVKLLALEPTHQLHRDQVADAIWPGLDAEAAAANLRKALHYARRALGSREAIGAGPALLRLWPGGPLRVDVDRFEAAARSALAGRSDPKLAARLYGGELLPEDRYADWTEPRRQRLRELCLSLWRAAGHWEVVLDLDRSNEEAHRALMRRHLDAGDRQAAIRQFEQLREVLRLDLGVGPEEETVALFEQALARRRPLLPAAGERAQDLLARGLMAWSRGELDEAESAGEMVRALALDHGLARELGEASSLIGMAAFAHGRWRERFRAEFEQALRLAPDQAANVFDGNVCLAETVLGSAEAAAVGELARELLPMAGRAGSVHGQALSMLLIGEAELASGSSDEAHGWLRRSIDLADKAGSASAQVLGLVRLAEIDCDRGEREAARRLLERAQPLAERSSLAPHLIVRVYAGRVNAESGEAAVLGVLAEAEANLEPGAVCGPCSIGFRVRAAIACARFHELSRARRCLAAAEALAGIWQGGPWRAATWEARAALRMAEGDVETSAGLLREAAELFSEYGRRRDAARCLASAGSLARPAGA